MARRLSVLVADDQPEFHRLITNVLLGTEFDVSVCVANGRDLVEEAIRSGPDVILADVEMPGMDGIEAMRDLIARGMGIPFLLMSANPHGLAQHVGRGAAGVIDKNELTYNLAGALRRVTGGESFISHTAG